MNISHLRTRIVRGYGNNPDFSERFRDRFSGDADADISLYRLGPEAVEALNGSGPSKESLEIVLSSGAREERKLKALQKALLSDRLIYRFNRVSQNPLHDRYWEMLLRALGLPGLRQHLAEQTREIDAYLERKSSEHSANVMRWPMQISGAGISALTTFTIIKEFIEAIDQKWIGHTIHEFAGFAAVTAGIIVALLALYLMRRAGSHPSAEGVKEHAIIENTGAMARKK